MLKTVADALTQFYEVAINGPEAANHAKAIHVREMAEYLKMYTLDLVVTTVPLSTNYRRLCDTARAYRDGDPRNREEMIARRYALKTALHHFARVIDTAEADEGAAFLTSMNTSQVPNPLAGVL